MLSPVSLLPPPSPCSNRAAIRLSSPPDIASFAICFSLSSLDFEVIRLLRSPCLVALAGSSERERGILRIKRGVDTQPLSQRRQRSAQPLARRIEPQNASAGATAMPRPNNSAVLLLYDISSAFVKRSARHSSLCWSSLVPTVPAAAALSQSRSRRHRHLLLVVSHSADSPR